MGKLLCMFGIKLWFMFMDKSYFVCALLGIMKVDTVYLGAGVSDELLAAVVDKYYYNCDIMWQLCDVCGISMLWFM